MKYFKFEKENNGRWYIVLPEWDGSHSDLEMVMGADTMLDIFAQGAGSVDICMDEKPFKGYTHKLTFDRWESGGAWYDLKSDLHEFPV